MKNFFRLFILPSAIGIIGGLSAILMRELIKGSKYAFALIPASKTNEAYIVIIPILFVISAFIINTVMEGSVNPTIDSVARSIVLKKGRLDYKKGIGSVVLTAVNIGFGLPVGREGPIAKLGGSLTSLFLNFVRIEGANIPLLVSCGVSSALAATFNAPIAAIIFGLEIILGRLSFDVIIPLSISSAIGTAISRYFLGNYPAFFVPKLSYNLALLFLVPLFSFLFAAVVYAFEAVFRLSTDIFKKLDMSWFSKALIGGFLVGVLLFLFPSAASLGYKQVSMLFFFDFSYRQAFVLGLVKLIALAITFASGMFGGIFAPSIFGGAFMGYAIGGFLHQFIPSVDPLSVALIGTASITASISSAPFRSTLIVVELAQNYHMILPLIMGSVMTMYFSHLFEEKIHYARSVMQKGFDITNERYVNELKKMRITNFIDSDIPALKKEDVLKDVMFILMKSSSSYFAVVEDDKLVGVLSFRDIRLIGEFGNPNMRVVDVMTHNPSFLMLNSNGLDVFEFLSKIDVDFIPVVNNPKDKRYLGMLNVNSFLKFASFLYFKDSLSSNTERNNYQAHP
ncbi:chloride channel protein [Hippea alviniae]|uniref:chloride channel protein n=1 Tax=Hippea alviniae TaxID=1279027 RepID=UPI000409CE59|nr:chloride channel protein [Hippea alviniae]